MRGNGLHATTYVPIAELDAGIGDLLLELLRRGGIAAYTEPQQPMTGPLPEVDRPQEPRERLYVDENARGAAEELLRRYLREDARANRADPASAPPTSSAPGSGDPPGAAAPEAGVGTDDEAWERLVAAYHSEPAGQAPSWPAIEDLPDGESPADGESRSDREARGARTDRRSRGFDLGTIRTGATSGPARQDDQEHFVPPPPPPLPQLDTVTKSAWIAMVGGPAVLLAYILMDWTLSGWILLACVVAFVGGFCTLVLRLPGRSSDDPEDPDQGAVV